MLRNIGYTRLIVINQSSLVHEEGREDVDTFFRLSGRKVPTSETDGKD